MFAGFQPIGQLGLENILGAGRTAAEMAVGHLDGGKAGFTLDDGSRITVQKNWWGKDEKAEFLHKVAAGACKLFSVVLTPKSNRLHHDHLHLDNGPYKKCDA
jgi:hypothetical protein